MRRPIKAHLINRSNRPVNRSNRPVYRSKPVTHAILNLDLNSNRSNRPVNRSNRSVYRYEPVELSFLNSNLNLTGQTGPVYRNRSAPVWGYRLGKKTMRAICSYFQADLYFRANMCMIFLQTSKVCESFDNRI